MGGETEAWQKNVRVFRPNYAMRKARKRSEEVAQLRHCVSVDCRSSLKVQEQSFLPSLRLLIQSGGRRGGDHYCRVNWLVWGTPPPSVTTKQAEEEALGGRAAGNCAFWRSFWPLSVMGVAHLPLCSDDLVGGAVGAF